MQVGIKPGSFCQKRHWQSFSHAQGERCQNSAQRISGIKKCWRPAPIWQGCLTVAAWWSAQKGLRAHLVGKASWPIKRVLQALVKGVGQVAEVGGQVLAGLLRVLRQSLGIASSLVSGSARAGQVGRPRVGALSDVAGSALGLDR